MKPKTPEQAFADFERKEAARERRAKRAARGLPDIEKPANGAHERAYQATLEAKGQLRLFGGAA